jgi:hypothetical protein
VHSYIREIKTYSDNLTKVSAVPLDHTLEKEKSSCCLDIRHEMFKYEKIIETHKAVLCTLTKQKKAMKSIRKTFRCCNCTWSPLQKPTEDDVTIVTILYEFVIIQMGRYTACSIVP